MPLLEVTGLNLFLRTPQGTAQALRHLSFKLERGSALGIIGESGSGKSLTVQTLMGLQPESATVSGSVLWEGQELLGNTEAQWQTMRGNRMAMIFQEPMTALNPLMSVGAQVAEVLQLKEALSAKQAWQQAVELLASTGIPEPARRAQAFPHQLSGGQRQRAMIAMALAAKPKLLLADEPTTALDVTLRMQILELLGDLQRQNGMAIVLITHDLHLVRRFADRAAVMEHGVLVEEGPVDTLFAHPKHAYTHKLLHSQPVREVREPLPHAPVVLQTQQLKVSYPVPLPGIQGWWRKGQFVAVQGADVCLREGQTLGIVGESGSGKSTLAQAILGLLPSSGALHIHGKAWQQPAMRNTAANQALRRQVQVVFQDPFSSLSPRMTVEDIVGEGMRVHAPDISEAGRREQVLSALLSVGLSEQQFPGLLQRYPHEFSGGQRQRLAVARALIVRPKVLVLDEPTSALDVTIQKQVLSLLQRLQRELGLSYVLITHDMDVIRAMAHTVLVMKAGEVVEQGSVDAVLHHAQHPYTQQLVSATL
jgi:microcin C transport system ATP-binding protein